MEARLTARSQTYRLVDRMEEAEIHHGQEIRADLPGLRVIVPAGGSEAEVRFCNLGPIRVRATFNSGDSRALPTDVVLDGLSLPASGTYDVLNARLSLNGNIRLVADDQTLFEAVPAPARHWNDWDRHELGCCGLSISELVF